jgi:carbon-monoxide dehydrogenase small subunit
MAPELTMNQTVLAGGRLIGDNGSPALGSFSNVNAFPCQYWPGRPAAHIRIRRHSFNLGDRPPDFVCADVLPNRFHIRSHNSRDVRCVDLKRLPMKSSITIHVNGRPHQHEIEPRLLLVHFLRDHCGLTGTHVGCETTLCGACTVLLNGRAVKACTLLAVQADGAEVTTIEGLARDGQFHPVQEAFQECHGLQCGFCTPGMILTSVELLQKNSRPSREEIVHAIDGNLCRCTGYSHIIDAVHCAAKKLAKPAKAK